MRIKHCTGLGELGSSMGCVSPKASREPRAGAGMQWLSPHPPGQLSSAGLRLGLESFTPDWELWRGTEQPHAPAVGRKRGEGQSGERLCPVPMGWCDVQDGGNRGPPVSPLTQSSQGGDALQENAPAAPPFSSHCTFPLHTASVSLYRRSIPSDTVFLFCLSTCQH